MRKIKAYIGRTPKITADATVVNQAWLERYLLPQLVREYKDDKEDFLSEFPAVPKSAIGKDGIAKNKLIDNVEAVINNTTDFTTPTSHDKKHLFLPWDSVDTKPSRTTRSELRGLPYDLNSNLRVRHMRTIKRLTRDFLLNKVAPAADTADTPVIELGGSMTYDKILEAITKLKKLNVDPRDCIMILSPDHVSQLASAQGAGERFRSIMFDEVQGKAKNMLGLGNVYEHNSLPFYDTNGDIRPFGATIVGTDKQASLILNKEEVLFHRENLELYFMPKNLDTKSADPADTFRLGGYFVADTLEKKGFVSLY